MINELKRFFAARPAFCSKTDRCQQPPERPSLPSMRPTRAHVLVALIGLSGVAPGWAGVAVTSESDSTAPIAAPGAAPGATGVAQDKTIELLLQLQDQQQRRPSADNARRDITPSPAKAAAALPAMGDDAAPTAPAAPSLREGLITEAARFAAESRQDMQDAGARGEAPASQMGTPLQPLEPRAPSGVVEPPSILSNPVIRFVRENRGWALGAGVAVLVAVWLTANVSLRGRRR
ncbi:MAG: hypothetical protein U1F56_18455 [Rubrivivax sp.]